MGDWKVYENRFLQAFAYRWTFPPPEKMIFDRLKKRFFYKCVSINRILQIRSLINMPPDQQKLAERHALSFIPFCIQTNFLFLSICGECACCKRCDNASYKPIFCGQWLSNFQGGNIGIVPLWDLPTCDKEYKMKEGNLSQGPTCICNILLNSSYNLTINFLFLKKE